MVDKYKGSKKISIPASYTSTFNSISITNSYLFSVISRLAISISISTPTPTTTNRGVKEITKIIEALLLLIRVVVKKSLKTLIS